jgi:hypothetical protein
VSVDSILRRQGGVISRGQATAAGLTPGAVDDRLRRRHWVPLHPRVYLTTGRPVDVEVRIRAALLWAGDGAVLVGAAAAWWHGLLDRPPATITVVLPRRPPRARRGIVLRRRSLAADDVTELRGVRVAGRPLAALEAAVELGTAGVPLLDRVPLPALYAAHLRNPSATARRLLGAAADRSTAAAVRLLVRLLRESEVGGWGVCGHEGGGRSDGGSRSRRGAAVAVSFPAARVAIRVTGWAPPVDEPAVAWPGPEWSVLRVSGPDLVLRPGEVLAEIVAAVGRSSTNPGDRRCRRSERTTTVVGSGRQ